VSTVNNYSISLSRIVNLNRSPNAIVVFELKFSIRILEGDKLKDFRDALEKYVRDRPRIWDSLLFCRHDFFVPDITQEYVLFTIAFKHRQNWQNAMRININRADLLRYIFDLGKELNIQYNTPPSRRLVLGQDQYARAMSAPLGTLGISDSFDPVAVSGPMDSDVFDRPPSARSLQDTQGRDGADYTAADALAAATVAGS